MPFVRNPSVKNFKVLGLTLLQWNALKTSVQAHLDTNDNLSSLNDVPIRALNPSLANNLIWNEIKKELNIRDNG